MKTPPFELSIVGGVEDATANPVTLAHGQPFKVALTNRLPSRRCNVHLSFNGKPAGEYRVLGGQTIVLRRPANQETLWTFLQLGTAEAKAAKLPLDGSAGALKAVFVPESSPEERLYVEGGQITADAEPLSKEAAAELMVAFNLAPLFMPSLDAVAYTPNPDGTFQEADDIFSFNAVEAIEIELRLQGRADDALLLDARDVLLDEVARLEAAMEKASADFDYGLAFKIGKQVRAKERELRRCEWQAELTKLRRELTTMGTPLA